MEIVTKVMEKSWKSHGNLLVQMCTNPDSGKSEEQKMPIADPRSMGFRDCHFRVKSASDAAS